MDSKGGESDPPTVREAIRYFIIPPLFVVFLQYIMVVIALLFAGLKQCMVLFFNRNVTKCMWKMWLLMTMAKT